MAETSTASKKDILQALGVRSSCGSCEYHLVDGVWTRIGTGNCTGACTCPATKTAVEMELIEVLSPRASNGSNGTKTVNCTPPASIPLSDDLLLAHLNELLEGVEIKDGTIFAVLKKTVQDRNFWRRTATGLAIASLLLLAGLVYALFFR
jgi:bacterioferritin-associated ferredoxin